MASTPAKVEKPADVNADIGDDEDVDPKTFDLPKPDIIYLATDKKFEEKYDSLQELGKGKFGVVKKVKNKETGEVLAAKFIKTSAESKKEVLGEMAMMNHLHSRRLTYLADAFERPGEMIVIMELVSGGELFEKICQDDNLTEKEVIRYMRQILQGVEHMHRKNMVHLDLKPENVLCVIRPDGKEDLKLIDFGMAHIIEKGKDLKLACGTPEFVAPEVIGYDTIRLSSDMWSIGVIAYILLSGLSPFMGDDDNETIMNVSTAEWDFEDESFDVVSDLSKKYIEELLLKDESKRKDVYQCLNHEWLKKGKTMESKKLSTDNLKKFLARRRWQKTSNALRALSRLGSMGLGGGGGGGGGGLLGKVKGKIDPVQEDRLTPGRRVPAGVPLTGRRGPALSGSRSTSHSQPNHGIPPGPPKFKLPLKNCEAVDGSAARFQCQVTGNPEPDVEWYHDGKKLRESKQLTFLYDENDNCKLIITEGRQKDAGVYKVIAVNPHGQVSCSANLVIKEQHDSSGESGGEAGDSEISDDESDEDEGEVPIRSGSLTSFYGIKDELGKGRFGVVCKCVRKKDGKEFAAKFIKCSKTQERDDVKHEVDIMNIIRHKRLLRLTDAFESPTELILIMELVTGGELFEKVVEDEFISENDVIHYMKQIIQGVQHMHLKEVLHLDLKPENIMIVRPNSRQIKLIDFGLARKYNPKENLKVMFGTPEFVAPEVLTYDRITPATDMWSIGVIAYVLLSGLSPFMGDNDAETLANVQMAEWDFDDPFFDDISDDAKGFIGKFLILKASERITVEKCLKHPWLTEKREPGKQINTNRLKAFTARRKWKKALTAIRSTNFLSKLMGSRGAQDGNKKPGAEGGGGGGLLARVKAMHVAGVQAPESGPASSPFLSPSATQDKSSPKPPSGATPKATTTNTGKSSSSTTPTAPAPSTAPKKVPSTPATPKPAATPSFKTPDAKTTASKTVSTKASESKSSASNDVSTKASNSKTLASNASADSKASTSNDVSTKASKPKVPATKDVSTKAFEPKVPATNDVSTKASKPKVPATKDVSTKAFEPKLPSTKDVSTKAFEPKLPATKDVSTEASEPKVSATNGVSTKEPKSATDTPSPAKSPANKTSESSSPANTPGKPTTARESPAGRLPRLGQWPPPAKEPRKREIEGLVEKYGNIGIPLSADNPETRYDIAEEIDRGKFAVIKKCIDRKTKKSFAAKLIKFEEDEANETVQEFDVHRILQHKNIVSLHSAFIVQKYLVLILDLIEGKDSLTYLATKTRPTEDDVANIIKQVIDALEFIHIKDIVHLDIRPANILVHQNTVKLIDFGCARRLKTKQGEVGAVVGNTEFTAPEVLLFEPVGTSADMWSVGVTTYLLLSAELPFTGDDEEIVAEAVKTGILSFDDDVFRSTTKHAKEFFMKLICKVPRKRMNAATARAHEWLSPSFGRERRKAFIAKPGKLTEISEELLSQEEDELVSASCVLRTFNEDSYESSGDDDEEDDD